MTMWTREEIVSYIKNDLLLGQLQLGDTGVSASDIQEDTPLLDGGLSIDSVDALDLLVGIEKKFKLTLPELGKPFLESTCANVGSLADYVQAELAKTASPVT